MPWISKYAPQDSTAVVQPNVVRVKKFLSDFRSEKRKALFLYGPPGSCKSSTVYALAKELNLEVIETNASDARTKDKLNAVVGAAMVQQSLFMRGKVILIDEVDGLSGTKDRGAPGEIAKLIDKSAFPVVLTANDAHHSKLKALRKKAVMVEFAPLTTEQIQKVLERICSIENITYEPNQLRTIARRSGGDMRAAINDVQSVVADGKVDAERFASIGERNQTEELKSALLKVFKTTDPDIALRAYDSVAENYDKIAPWVEENVPYEYTVAEDLARAFDSISRADIFKRRIMRRQHWRFLTYISMHLSAGVATAKTQKLRKPIEYKETRRFLKMWMAKVKYGKRNTIAERLSESLHCSKSKVLTESLPYLKLLAKSDALAGLDLDKDEIAWLRAN